MGKQVGSLVRQLREKRGLSQGDVAKLLSLKTAQSISNIERGVSPLPRNKIKRLADVLGVKKNDLVGVVISETQERIAKAAGVTGKGSFAGVALEGEQELSSEESTILMTLVERFKTAKAADKTNLKKQVKKILELN